MKKNWKRLIAVFCVLAMACSVVPKFEPMQVEAETATTVTYDEITEGTITGGVAPEAKDGYVFGGWYKSVSGDEGAYVFSNPLAKGEVVTASAESPVYAKWVPEEVLSVKAQYRQEEEDAQTTSIQFFDCDTATADETFKKVSSGLGNTFTLSTATGGDYKEGNDALKSAGTEAVHFLIQRNAGQELDASAYISGGLKFWLYIEPGTTISKDLRIALGSGANNETDCYQWAYNRDELSEGWNEITLDFRETLKVNGTVDMTKLSLFQIWHNANDEVTMILDDVRIVGIEGMLFDCDDKYNTTTDYVTATERYGGLLNTSGVLTTTAGEYKEGSGAYKVAGTGAEWFVITKTTPVDLTDYWTGTLHFWLHISDPTQLTNALVVELGSSSSNYIRFDLQKDNLGPGWNECNLKIADGALGDRTIDKTSINYFRIQRSANSSITMILDDVRVVKRSEGMLFDCDKKYDATTEKYGGLLNTSGAITTTSGEYKEGSGAYKVAGTGAEWFVITKTTPVDLTDYWTGTLHFWLYISDPSQLTNVLVVELGSSASDYIRFDIQQDKLVKGWNECNLAIANGALGDRTIDKTKINYFRIQRSANSSITMILDDVRIVQSADSTEGMLLDCDSKIGSTSVTTTPFEYKEGTGAYKSTGTGIVRYAIEMSAPVDVSKDSANKTQCKYSSIRFWLYISNVEYWDSNMNVELSSDAANHDSNEIQWSISKEHLVTGWNEIYLSMDKKQASGNTGEVDFSNICWLRIYKSGNDFSQSITTILDDVEFVSENDTSAELRFVSTVDSENYQSAGFKIALTDVNGVSKGTKVATTKTVYSKLIGISETEGVLTYEPTCFHEDSDYFYAAIFDKPMPSQVFDSVLTVTPYWVTPDGTEVTGVQRLFTMNYIINGVMNLDNH